MKNDSLFKGRFVAHVNFHCTHLLQDPDEQTSVLDKDPAAKAMLSLIGKGPLSEGLRETDATAQSPEQHDLPPI